MRLNSRCGLCPLALTPSGFGKRSYAGASDLAGWCWCQPVTTTTIRRCPEGYEVVSRANGRPGCAKGILPANE